ncbi:cytochrome c [Phormidium yuhuli AB48]|uniref:Cytochrome c n=1 Tax=Phormidium yuhuli AB48 TaxID=2940671 RepID=A0ABY5AJV7_9CYAN|nr:cytochrome c [Phormidium yuhuli]USR89472.1 cytochrome c [Phormidium yuhuli AB48]
MKTPALHFNVDRLIRQLSICTMVGLLLIGLSMFTIHQLQVSDPYIQEVLALDGDPEQGYAIFQMNCSGCHGDGSNGMVGPSLRDISAHKSRASLIRQVIKGDTPPMPQFQPSPQIMSDLLAYLETL